jgi:outer membrane autotransporter protein
MARGIIVGMDMLKLDMMVFGVAAGYGTSEIEPDQFGIGDIDIDHYPLILYAELHGIRPWRINAALSVARNSYQTERTIRFGSIDRTTSGSFDGQQYDLYIEGVYDLLLSSFKLTPSFSLNYSYMSLEEYQEGGADALDLSVQSEDYSFLRSGFGLAASTLWNVAKIRIVPQIYGKCQYEWLNPSIKTTAAFKGTDTSFETTAVESSDNTLETGISWDFLLPKEMSIKFNYDAEFSEEYSANILSAQFKSKF